jgi:hypothetical protein
MQKCICVIALSFCLFVLISGCSSTPDEIGPYLGQTPPGSTPQVFAPGIISTDSAIEFSTTFSADGSEFYFTRRVEGEDNVLYETHFSDGAWSEPAPVSFTTGLEACEPFISADNKTIYFSVFTNDTSAIWAADRTNEGWSEARYVGKGMFITGDQNGQFYVTSDAERNPSVSKVTINEGVFTDFEFITSGVHPVVSPDGSYLVCDNGNGNFQVRFLNEDGTWGTAKALASQGIPATAAIGAISPDGLYFFFVDQQDIYWVSTEVITNLR